MTDDNKFTDQVTSRELVNHFLDKIKHFKPAERRNIIEFAVKTNEEQIQKEFTELQQRLKDYQPETA